MNNILLIDEYSTVISGVKTPINAYITGSRAIGEEREGRYVSDVDILVTTQDIEKIESVKAEIEQIYCVGVDVPQASYVFAINQIICNNFYSGLVRRTNFSTPIRRDYDLQVKKEYTLFQLLNSSLQCVMYYLSKYYNNKSPISCYKSLRSMFETEFLLVNLKMPNDLHDLLAYLKKNRLHDYIRLDRYVNYFYKGSDCYDSELYEFTLQKFQTLIVKMKKYKPELYYDSLKYLLSVYSMELILEKLHDFSKVFSMVQQENMGVVGGVKDYG